MNFSRRNLRQLLGSVIIILVPITIIVYLLRGIGILSGMSGGVLLWLLVLSSIPTIAYGLEKTR